MSVFRWISKSMRVRLVFAFVILSMHVHCQPLPQQTLLRYSQYARQVRPVNLAKNMAFRQMDGGLRNVEIMDPLDDREAVSGEIESLDPTGFIPKPSSSPSSKPVTPKPAIKPSLRTLYDQEEMLELLQLKKDIISNIRTMANFQPIYERMREPLDEDKKRMRFAELLWKIFKLFRDRRQMELSESTAELEIQTRTKRQTRMESADAGTFTSNLTKREIVDKGNQLNLREMEDFHREDLSDLTGREVRDDDDDDEDEGEADENGGGDEDKQSSESESSEESDEEPVGDGGGILGILVGLSGEGGMSDLGDLLSAVSSIIANLSGGPGFDLDAIIGSAVGLFAGISAGDGTLPIGKQIAKYYVTGFEGFTGGGAMANGKFLGDFLNAIITGSSTTSAEDSQEGEPEKDSGLFFRSLLAALFNKETEAGGEDY